jgi:hypothetical protein
VLGRVERYFKRKYYKKIKIKKNKNIYFLLGVTENGITQNIESLLADTRHIKKKVMSSNK